MQPPEACDSRTSSVLTSPSPGLLIQNIYLCIKVIYSVLWNRIIFFFLKEFIFQRWETSWKKVILLWLDVKLNCRGDYLCRVWLKKMRTNHILTQRTQSVTVPTSSGPEVYLSRPHIRPHARLSPVGCSPSYWTDRQWSLVTCHAWLELRLHAHSSSHHGGLQPTGDRRVCGLYKVAARYTSGTLEVWTVTDCILCMTMWLVFDFFYQTLQR